MLDSYFFGKSNRKSPEAPVQIVDLIKKEHKAGGAGNVAFNLTKLGVKTFLFGFVGNDKNGDELISIFKKNKIKTSGVIQTKNKTTTKIRIINSSNKQLIRIDEEKINYKQLKEKKKISDLIEKKIHLTDLIIIQDYNKGLLDESFIKKILLIGKKNKIPIMADPKELNFLKYKNIKLIKPNLLEAEKILNKKIKINNSELKKDLKTIQEKTNCELIMLTLGKDGLCIYGKKMFHREKGIQKEIQDVTGAGDGVICFASLAVCLGLKMSEIAKLSNYAGFLSCKEMGANLILNHNFKNI